MRPQNGRPPPRDAGGDLSNERIGNRLDNKSIAQESGPQLRPASPEIIAALDELKLDYISEALDFVASFAMSGREAARRRNRELLRLHAGQARLALDAVFEVEGELGKADTGAGV
jgi:hypothetical protein